MRYFMFPYLVFRLPSSKQTIALFGNGVSRNIEIGSVYVKQAIRVDIGIDAGTNFKSFEIVSIFFKISCV